LPDNAGTRSNKCEERKLTIVFPKEEVKETTNQLQINFNKNQ